MIQTVNKPASALVNSIRTHRGFSLIELVIALAIFATVIVGLYKVYDVQFSQQVKEYRVAESSMELGIAKNLIERDLIMAGYGIMDDYGTTGFTARAASAAEGTGPGGSDKLTTQGTALGIGSRAAQEWADVTATAPTLTFSSSTDARENLISGDRIIITNPSGTSGKTILTQAGQWYFQYNGQGNMPTVKSSPSTSFTSLQTGHVFYGLNTSSETDATFPYYTVLYSLGSITNNPSYCAPGTYSLLRAESRTSNNPTGGDPVISCVLDFQVAFGLTDNIASLDPSKALNYPINYWDNGGVNKAAAYTPKELNQRLKQIRVYILVQEGNKDLTYNYVNPDPNAAAPDKIRVGELGLAGGATGRDFQLSAAQRQYRWRVLTIVVTPRNIRG